MRCQLAKTVSEAQLLLLANDKDGQQHPHNRKDSRLNAPTACGPLARVRGRGRRDRVTVPAAPQMRPGLSEGLGPARHWASPADRRVRHSCQRLAKPPARDWKEPPSLGLGSQLF